MTELVLDKSTTNTQRRGIAKRTPLRETAGIPKPLFRQGASKWLAPASNACGLGARSRFRGEENRGCRSSTRPTGSGTAVFVDDLFADPQSKAGADCTLRREEGLEGMTYGRSSLRLVEWLAFCEGHGSRATLYINYESVPTMPPSSF
jgi:hypothetical protein